VVAEVGEDGRLPMPSYGEWDVFPWDAVDGAVVPRVLQPPTDEPVRSGEGDRPCEACAGTDPARVVWEDERWVLTHPGAPSGLPLVLMLWTREHLDFGDFDDELAGEYGRITSRLVRIMEHLPNVGRAHTFRIGDGGAHVHIWFVARTHRLTNVLGSPALEWDEILPPGPEDVWREDLRTVATKLANWGGTARA
jgi:diadenosine tetraphosphate (Ap4A) HIT family hydrolase